MNNILLMYHELLKNICIKLRDAVGYKRFSKLYLFLDHRKMYHINRILHITFSKRP